jgi:hydroxymethylglutaryl-CoA lyase
MSVKQSLEEITAIARDAKSRGIRVRGYVSTAWGCPFEGRVEPKAVIGVVTELLALPLDQVSIGDTIGVAVPGVVEALLKPILSEKSRLAVHFHDTRGTALANAAKAFELGIRTFDSSIGGLGGCPFAPGASGNLSTEDLVYFFKESGVETGVDYRLLCETSLDLMHKMGRAVFSSKALQAFQAHCMKADPWDS